MPRFEVYLDPRWKKQLEKALENPEIIKELVKNQLKEDATGVAKLGAKFLLDADKLLPIMLPLMNVQEIDDVLEKEGYTSREEFVNDAVRRLVASYKEEKTTS